MSLFFFLIFFWGSLIQIQCKTETKTEVIFTNGSVVFDENCGNVSVSLTNSKLNIRLKLFVQIERMFVEYDVKYKTSKNKYENLLSPRRFEFCDFIKNTNVDLIFNLVYQQILSDKNNSFIRSCPILAVKIITDQKEIIIITFFFQGDYYANNIYLDAKLLPSFFITTDFYSILRFNIFNPRKHNLFTLYVYGTYINERIVPVRRRRIKS